VGGEPLMQKDIVDIVQSVNKDKCQVMMFTNGWFLKEKAKDLKKAGLTTIIVSIDSADQAAHDKFKGKDGLFEKAVEGIKEAVKQKLLVGISSVIHKEDIDNGNLAKIIEMSKKLKINQNIVFEAIPVGNYSSKTDLSWTDEEREKLINYCDQYNNKKNYQGVYAYSYVKSYKSMGCSGGVIYFYVSPYGDVCPCDFNSLCVGNVKNEPLHVLWDKFNEKNSYCSTSLSGCRSQK
jgi:MoaA/NifB/PqqE/SkfB family radical SAM enzyme